MAVGGAELANGLSWAHSRAMDYILVKFANFLIAICVALMIALTLGFVAHYHYGLSRLDIRTSALTGAAIFSPDLRPSSGDRVVRKAAKIQMTKIGLALSRNL